ncbi:MAG: hypothetical protein ACREQL_13345, partial [Candidatus Binatia bacterium]
RYPAAIALAGVVTAGFVARGVALRARMLALGVAAIAALAVFFVASPFTFLELDRVWARLGAQLLVTSSTFLAPPGLPLQVLLPTVTGWVALALAVLGAGVLAVTRPREGAPLLVTSLLMLWSLGQAHRIFARYTLSLVPIVCVLAAVAIRAIVARVPRQARPVAALALVLVALADPAWRAIVFVRLLAREDTRRAAGAWLSQMQEKTSTVWLAPSWTPYMNPVLPLTLGAVAWRLGRDVSAKLAARQRAANPVRPPNRFALYDERPRRLEALGRRGGFVVTAEHPVLTQWDQTPSVVRELLASRGTVVKRFVGLSAEVADRTLFDPIDANFVPLRGMDALQAPGPTITVWYLPPGARQG